MNNVKRSNTISGLVKVAALTAAWMVTASASATMIFYQTRYTDKNIDQTNYRASWSDQTSLVTPFVLDEFTNVTAPASHRHSHLTVEFDVNAANAGDDWGFRFGVDAAYGGAMYLNDDLIDMDTTDLWWGGDFADPGELLMADSLSIDDGPQTLELFWAEGCCNGGQSGQFTVNGTDWQDLTVDNLAAVSVPEPGMLFLVGSGLLGLGLARRSRRRT